MGVCMCMCASTVLYAYIATHVYTDMPSFIHTHTHIYIYTCVYSGARQLKIRDHLRTYSCRRLLGFTKGPDDGIHP